MNLTLKLATIAIGIFLATLAIVGESLIVKVPIGMVGVRTQRIALLGDQGVELRDYGAGWHRRLWLVDEWDLFDSTVQTFNMSQRSANPFQLKSYDGYSVNMDVTIKYRIQDGKAHELRVNQGSGSRYKGFVENLARDACRSAFGVMRTEAFYQPTPRTAATSQAIQNLETGLKENKVPIQIVDVLIRNVRFDEQYERKIKDKKLADQDIQLNRSKALAATEKGRTNKIEAETKAMVQVVQQEREATLTRMRAETEQTVAKLVADYEKKVMEMKADADLHASQKDAQGLLLTKQAEAEGELLRNRALAGPGGAVMAALLAVKNITVEEVTYSSLQLDPLNLDSLMRRLGVPEE